MLADMRDRALLAERERDKAQEALKTGGLLDIIDRAGHDRAEAIRERDEARKWSAMLADACDEIRAQLREEQRLHIQTLNERDEAREALETGGLLGILDRAGHDRAEAIRERDELLVGMQIIARKGGGIGRTIARQFLQEG